MSGNTCFELFHLMDAEFTVKVMLSQHKMLQEKIVHNTKSWIYFVKTSIIIDISTVHDPNPNLRHKAPKRCRKMCENINGQKTVACKEDPNTKRFKQTLTLIFVFGSCFRTLAAILFQIFTCKENRISVFRGLAGRLNTFQVTGLFFNI